MSNYKSNFTFKTRLWKRLLKYLKEHIVFLKEDTIFEIGGGKYPFVWILNKNGCVNIDPYNKSKYKKYKFQQISIKIEDFHPTVKYDKVICLNAFDEIDNINLAVKNIRRLCKKGGYFILGVKTYNHKIIRWLIGKGKGFMTDDIIDLFNDFRLVHLDEDLEGNLPKSCRNTYKKHYLLRFFVKLLSNKKFRPYKLYIFRKENG